MTRKTKNAIVGLFGVLLIDFCFLASCSPRGSQTTAINPTSGIDSVSLGYDARIRAGQFYEGDQLDSALFWYTRATQFNRNDKHAWHGVASTLGRLGRHNEAGPAFDEALRIDSNYVAAIWHRACSHANTRNKAQALADLRRAIALDSTIKSHAQQDQCFDWLWEDKEFLAIVH